MKLVPISIAIWTLVSTILHFSGVGSFAEWSFIAWPWQWSCLCILEWYAVVVVFLMVLLLGLSILKGYADAQNPFSNRG